MKTAMQDLREDLILTRTLAEESLLEIENQEVRKACQEVVRLTFNNIIKRINDELLELEKQQIGYSEEELLAFGKSCFYKGFEKAEKDDANCYTAFREEIVSLVEQFKNK